MRLVGGDTMNFWINSKRPELLETLKLMDMLLINDTEAKMLAGEPNLLRAAKRCWRWAPRRWSSSTASTARPSSSATGCSAASAITRSARPALPLDEVRDPTGAGDSFAGGFMGYIASQGEAEPSKC